LIEASYSLNDRSYGTSPRASDSEAK
jgi:hypothetical protein